MRKYLLLLMIALLAACGAAEPVANNDLPAGGQATDNNAEVEQTENVDTGGDLEAVPAIQPSTFPIEAAEIRGRDWTKGAEEPLVSIIEFGDFQ